MNNSPITTHILDTSRGLPAAGVAVRLEHFTPANQWQPCGQGITNADGRLFDLLKPSSLTPGRYRLTFATGDYFATLGITTFYPQVSVEFLVESSSAHYHVPLLISPFGYSTYRGS